MLCNSGVMAYTFVGSEVCRNLWFVLTLVTAFRCSRYLGGICAVRRFLRVLRVCCWFLWGV